MMFYATSVELGPLGEVMAMCDYDYQPEQKEIQNPPEESQEHLPASVTLTSFNVQSYGPLCLADLIGMLDEDYKRELETKIHEENHGGVE